MVLELASFRCRYEEMHTGAWFRSCFRHFGGGVVMFNGWLG